MTNGGAKMGDERSETIEDQTQMDNGIGEDNNGGGEEEKRETGYNRDKPPQDDCCPICFGDFTVPCKANCGHWFCGSCISELWEYRSRPRPCKCPFCSSAIYKLVPELSAVDKTEIEVVEVLANIEQYNHLYADDINAFFLILAFYLRKHGPYLHLYLLQELPAFIKNQLVNLIRHPEGVRPDLERVCLMTLVLGLIVYSSSRFFLSGHPPWVKLTKFTMWTEFVCLVIVFLSYIASACKTSIRMWCFKLRMRQLRRDCTLWQSKKQISENEVSLTFSTEEAALDENNVLLQNNVVADVAQQQVKKNISAL